MLTVQGIAALLPDGSDPDLAQQLYTAVLTGGNPVEIQEWLEVRGIVQVGDRWLRDSIFSLIASTPAPPPPPIPGPKGDRGLAGEDGPIGLVASIGIVVAIVFAVVYYYDSKTVDDNFAAVKAEMPEIAGNAAKVELKSTFGEELLAAASTWAKPVEPQCPTSEPQYSEHCTSNTSLVCAMKCCERKAQRFGVLGATCRTVVRQSLGPPAPYPPPPVSSNP